MSSALGGIAWLAMAATAFPTPDPIAQLLLLAVFVTTPLAIALTATPSRADRDPLAFRAALILQPIAAVSLAASYLAPAGAWAAVLALPWLLVTLCAALFGLMRLLPRPTRAVEETCVDVGLLYFAVGGGWVLLSRLGARPLEFGETIVLLTAVHFHYAGPLASIIAGMTGRQLRRTALAAARLYRFSAVGVMLSPAVLAVGISFWSLLEAAAALSLATSLIALAIVTARLSATVRSQLARALLRISAAASVVAMLFAAGYGLGQGLHLATVSLPTMVRVHGWLNAVGFGLCGLLGWTLAAPKSALPHPGPPFSRLAGRGRIGADYFDRTAALRPGGRQPTGLVDSLAAYRRPDFEPDRVHPAIRAFYERTADFTLVVRAEWQPGFGRPSRIYRRLSRAVGQMNFPLDGAGGGDRITSRIVALDDARDGRTNVRAWVRWYSDTGEAIYAAAYATHTLGPQVYMNIAFPLPLGNLTSILRMEALAVGEKPDGVLLTTLPAPGQPGDEGVYFTNRLLPIRLPFDETIRVWPVPADGEDDPASGATVAARHDVWQFRARFLTLHYSIAPT